MPFLDAFVITRGPIRVDGDRIVLGEVAEGFFIVEEFPQEIEFSIYLQIGFEPEEWGEHVVRIELCILHGAPLALLQERELRIPEPGDDWLLPSIQPVILPFRGSATFETGFDIVVYVDDEEIGSKGVIVVRRSRIPDSLSGDLN